MSTAMCRRHIIAILVQLCLVLGLILAPHAFAQTSQWPELARAAAEALRHRREADAEKYLLAALQASDSAPRRAASLEGLVTIYVRQSRLSEAASYAGQLVRLGESLRGTKDRNVATGYRELAKMLRVVGLPTEAAALEATAGQVESAEPDGVCGNEFQVPQEACPLSEL